MTDSNFMDRLSGDAEQVERYLAHALDEAGDAPARLRDGMRLALLGGGKRLRPFLVMECASLFAVQRDSALPAAAALECLHCYSLVHDDLPAMDNDTLRRGKPTVWAAFDEWTAILVGDALLTLAFAIMADDKTHANPSVRAAMVLELAHASGHSGMVGGQCFDLQSDKLAEPAAPDFAYVRRMQSMKTGALLRFACEAGAILGEASGGDREALRTFGDQIGFAFQIADDLLDVDGSPETVGKATGKDSEAGKATLVELLGVDAARQRLRETEAAAIASLERFGGRADGLRAAARFIVARDR